MTSGQDESKTGRLAKASFQFPGVGTPREGASHFEEDDILNDEGIPSSYSLNDP